jgi:ABC-2 type transport system ATP-binding protein
MEPVITLQELTKRFKGKPAVDRLSLTVPRGAIFGLLGENGAGKSTTIKMLLGLLRADDGTATILGQDVWQGAVALRHSVSYVPEKPKFYDWMTVSEIGWFTAGFHKPEFQARFEEQIQRFQLDPAAKLKDLSKGQYAKVALALALAPDPQVLILDEPTSGLDLMVRREFLATMVGLAEEGKTVLISSHQVGEVERVASHVAFLSQGRLVLAAPLDELRQRVVRLRLRFERQAPNAGALGTVLQRNGTGKQWQAVVRDPIRDAIDTLRAAEDVFDFEESALALEEVYAALMGPREVAS